MNLIKNRFFTVSSEFYQLGTLLRPWRYNWSGLTFVHASAEYDAVGPEFVVDLGLLGLQLRGALNLPWQTEMSRYLHRLMEEHAANPDRGSMMLPLTDLRRLRLRETDTLDLDYAGESYIISRKDPIVPKQVRKSKSKLAGHVKLRILDADVVRRKRKKH